jgi:hypothetical protein
MAEGGMVDRRFAWKRQLSRALLWFFVTKAPTPLMRYVRRTQPTTPFEEFVFVGRRSGRERRLLLALHVVDGAWYVGHPNGTSNWIRNLEGAGGCTVVRRDGVPIKVAAAELARGPERDAVIAAAGRVPAPAGFIFRRARGHIDAVGRYFRLTPIP